jgi:hypothetical protein
VLAIDPSLADTVANQTIGSTSIVSNAFLPDSGPDRIPSDSGKVARRSVFESRAVELCARESPVRALALAMEPAAFVCAMVFPETRPYR